MSNQSEALRLAEQLEAIGLRGPVAAELRRLHAENFTLAAGQCVHATADEGGTPMCAEVERLQSARERDNVSFKQLLAQRNELLEALERSRAQWIHSVNADRCLAAIAKAQQ